MSVLLSEPRRFSMSVNGESLNYSNTGIVMDHTTQRVRGCAILIDPDDSFGQLLRGLRLKQVVRLKLSTSGAEVQYDGDAEVVMVRERLSGSGSV